MRDRERRARCHGPVIKRPDALKIERMSKKQAGKRAEIAGRAHIKYFNESNCKLAAEYDIDPSGCATGRAS